MTSPLDGDQNTRGHYVGPSTQTPLVRALAVGIAIILCGLMVMGLDSIVAAILYFVFFRTHSYGGVYFITLLVTLFLISLSFVLESFFPTHE